MAALWLGRRARHSRGRGRGGSGLRLVSSEPDTLLEARPHRDQAPLPDTRVVHRTACTSRRGRQGRRRAARQGPKASQLQKQLFGKATLPCAPRHVLCAPPDGCPGTHLVSLHRVVVLLRVVVLVVVRRLGCDRAHAAPTSAAATTPGAASRRRASHEPRFCDPPPGTATALPADASAETAADVAVKLPFAFALPRRHCGEHAQQQLRLGCDAVRSPCSRRCRVEAGSAQYWGNTPLPAPQVCCLGLCATDTHSRVCKH